MYHVRYYVSQYAAVLPVGLIWKKSKLNWKLKISNMAQNANITQSQVYDARHRRMQEVNSLCTDRGPHQAEYYIMVFHTIQPSSFVILLWLWCYASQQLQKMKCCCFLSCLGFGKARFTAGACIWERTTAADRHCKRYNYCRAGHSISLDGWCSMCQHFSCNMTKAVWVF